ncbi:MAG: hypothetical protein RBS43_06195 [Candidatus Cloacimonas sp.]|jgi:hypothetical protein|nr:hypothetical protein [Candidatus Cloacimonas sp.]
MNKIESSIMDHVLALYQEKNMLTYKSIEKLKKLMLSGKMKSEDWISIIDNDRPEAEEGQNEN